MVTNASLNGQTATLTVTGGGTFSGAVQDASGVDGNNNPIHSYMALTVGGTGQTLTLSGTSTNTGPFTVNGTDTLLVNGSETSGVSVSSNATWAAPARSARSPTRAP